MLTHHVLYRAFGATSATGRQPTPACRWEADVRLSSGIFSGQNDPDPALLELRLFDGGHHTRELRIGQGLGGGPQFQIATRGDVKKRSLGEVAPSFHLSRCFIQAERCAILIPA